MKESLSGEDRLLADALDDLAGAVAGQLGGALDALAGSDLGGADLVVQRDTAINAARWDIEERVTTSLERGARGDTLRFLVAALHVSGELERMGDHAEGIAKVALMLGRPPLAPVPPTLLQLGDAVKAMLHDGAAAFSAGDAAAAVAICRRDDEVDSLYDQVCGELFHEMARDSETITACTYLLWAAHNLERVADRVTNLCERTVYVATGRIDEMNTSNY